nr:FkbM family methyltransferase [Chromatium okenii]
MVIVDGGAQHGVYSLTAAQQLQGSGAVLALEPTARAAQLLAHSVTENGFDALITVLPLGLAAQSGTAEISVYADRKPNNLDGQRRTEIVNQLTLDALMHVPQWQSGMNVDFLRLNVDGLAASVLFTGREFFAAQSPLLMLRVTGGAAIPSALLEAMKLLKMTLYRIVPGLNALVAVNVAQSLDNHQRNLFACRAERAQQLQARGLLLNAAEAQS